MPDAQMQAGDLPPWAMGGDMGMSPGAQAMPQRAAAPLYRSSLIQALRAATPAGPGNPGVSMLPNPANTTPLPAAPGSAPASGLIHNPAVLTLPAAPAGAAGGAAPAVRTLLEQFYDQAGGADNDASDGAGTPVGQGINNNLAGLGLALMAYGEAGRGIAPGSMVAGVMGHALAGHQANAMGQAADALSAMQQGLPPGVMVVSDPSGNVFGFSSPATVAAADAANFGPASTAVDGSTIGTDALGPY